MPEQGGQGGHCPPPNQYLADQLTLFQPGEGRLSQRITTAPPQIFSPSVIPGLSVSVLESYDICLRQKISTTPE